MSEQEFNSKSPAWHMAQIRANIKKARELNINANDLIQARRRYWESVRGKTNPDTRYLFQIAEKMAVA